uniref:Cyclin D-like protein n=1 Tax=Schmidtea mediterranea TaxID=79327 RepID=K9MXM2_SCHMD|nr:cyclin D-like protein [Schmidtea mediterranea]
MQSQNILYNNDDSMSFEQPLFDKFYTKNKSVLCNLLKLSNQDPRIGLPKAENCQERMKMRSVLIDWLRQVNNFRCSKPGVLALTVEIVDNYVCAASKSKYGREVNSQNYQCVGASAYHLASKLEEVTPVTANDMSKYTSDCVTPSDIMNFEIIIAFELGFSPKYVTPIDFIHLIVGYVDFIDDQKQLIANATNCYIDVIDNCFVKKFQPHIIGVCAVLVGYDDFENQNDDELDQMGDFLIDLVNANKNQLGYCYKLIKSVIESKKSQFAAGNEALETISSGM